MSCKEGQVWVWGHPGLSGRIVIPIPGVFTRYEQEPDTERMRKPAKMAAEGTYAAMSPGKPEAPRNYRGNTPPLAFRGNKVLLPFRLQTLAS